MPMLPDQLAKHVAEGSAFNLLVDRIALYNTAYANAQSAQGALTTATTNLNDAWNDALSKDTVLHDAVFVPPTGWTPPV